MAEAKSPAKKCACNFRTQYQNWIIGGWLFRSRSKSILVELRMVKGAEFCRQAPECSDKTELRIGHVNAKAELRLPRKVEAILRFTLHLNERTSRRDKLGDQARHGLYTAYVRSPILFAISKACASRYGNPRDVSSMA